MTNKKKSPTSNQDGVISTSLTLKDLTESEKALYDAKVDWFHSLGIAAPTRMIFDKIIKERKSNC